MNKLVKIVAFAALASNDIFSRAQDDVSTVSETGTVDPNSSPVEVTNLETDTVVTDPVTNGDANPEEEVEASTESETEFETNGEAETSTTPAVEETNGNESNNSADVTPIATGEEEGETPTPGETTNGDSESPETETSEDTTPSGEVTNGDSTPSTTGTDNTETNEDDSTESTTTEDE